MGRAVVRLGAADLAAVLELTGRDPVQGALLEYLVTVSGLDGPLRCYGLYEGAAGDCGNAGDHVAVRLPARPQVRLESGSQARLTLSGAFTYDAQGRATLVGGGPGWAAEVAAFFARQVQQGRPLTFVDLPEEMAVPLAALLPPATTEHLGIWAWAARESRARPGAGDPGAGDPGALTVRLAGSGDAVGLQSLYQTYPGLGTLRVEGLLAAAAAGQRLVVVGLVEGLLVGAAFASLVERGVSRISGVLTHPQHRNRGYAGQVVGELTRRVVASGRRPFLYVSLDNPPAMSIYERLGYLPHSRVVKLRYDGGGS